MSSQSNVPQASHPARPKKLNRHYWRDLAYAVAMIIGMLAREVENTIMETGAVNVQLPRLIGVLIWAPILYVAIFARLRRRNLSLLGLAFAFQLGFFWTSIVQAASEQFDIQHTQVHLLKHI